MHENTHRGSVEAERPGNGAKIWCWGVSWTLLWFFVLVIASDHPRLMRRNTPEDVEIFKELDRLERIEKQRENRLEITDDLDVDWDLEDRESQKNFDRIDELEQRLSPHNIAGITYPCWFGMLCFFVVCLTVSAFFVFDSAKVLTFLLFVFLLLVVPFLLYQCFDYRFVWFRWR